MAMIVKNNLPGNKSLNQLNKNSKALEKSLKKVASGMKINTAEDDASGYAVTERMQAQIRALDQDVANTQNGSAMLKTAEGAVENTVDILRTLKEKVLNAANDTNTDWDRKTIQKDLDQAVQQIDDNAKITYNGKYLIDGSKTAAMIETASHWTNGAFNKYTTADTTITDLQNRDDESLKMETSDSMTLSWVQGGETHSVIIDPLANEVKTPYQASNPKYDPFNPDPNVPRKITLYKISYEPMTLQEIIDQTGGAMEIASEDKYIGVGTDGKDVFTANGENAITIAETKGGVKNQISGISFTIKDARGDMRIEANKVFNQFSQTIVAQDKREDNAVALHVGESANQTTKVPLQDMGSVALGLKAPPPMFTNMSVATREHATVAIAVIDAAIERVLDQQTNIGAAQNRLEFTAANLTTASENTQASNSTMRDADMAKEMAGYTKNNVILQASQSMLAQANQNSSAVLSLLQ